MASTKKITNFEDDAQISKWLKEFQKIKKEILNIGPVRKGSLFERWHTCLTPNCKCKKIPPQKHGPYFAWTSKKNGKTLTFLVPPELVPEAKAYLKNADLLKNKINYLYDLSEEIFRRKITLHRKSVRPRPSEKSHN